MTRYARIDEDGTPLEIIEPLVDKDGQDVPIAERFHADVVARLIEWPDSEPLPPAPPPPPVIPGSVTMRQARLALLAYGKLAAVTEAINRMPNPAKEAAQIEWEFAATVDRDSAFVQSLAVALGLDDAALDALFTKAATL